MSVVTRICNGNPLQPRGRDASGSEADRDNRFPDTPDDADHRLPIAVVRAPAHSADGLCAERTNESARDVGKVERRPGQQRFALGETRVQFGIEPHIGIVSEAAQP